MKNIILLVLVLALGGLAYALLRDRDDSTTLDTWDREFAVEDVSKIKKIFIADRHGEPVTLERSKDGWIYNGKYKAHENVMENLLEVIQTVQLQSIPTQAALEHITRDMARNGIKVELYGNEEEPFKVYYVGGMTNNERGTYFIMENSDQPYVMEIPFMEGGLKYRFKMEPDDWRSKVVFNVQADEIASMEVLYPRQQGKSFLLEQKGADYYVSNPLVNEGEDIKVNKSKAQAYLDDLDQYMAEAYKNNHEKRDSIVKLLPFAVVDIKLKNEEEMITRFLPMRLITNDRVHVERLMVDCSWGDMMMIQAPVFQDVFRSYDYWVE